MSEAKNFIEERKGHSLASYSGYILGNYNEFTLLRMQFNELYPAYKPDDIFIEQLYWIVKELTIKKEIELLSLNQSLLRQKEIERKHKTNR